MGDHIADTTVILEIGDHPFIEKQSVVLYAKAENLDIRKIEAELNKSTLRLNWKQFDCCTDELLKRVRRGLLTSKYTKRVVKDYCRRLWSL